MRHAYTLKWNLFVEWCSSHREDPRRCPIRAVFSFLQEGLERRLSPSTLKVYVAAIATHHDPVDSESLGKHNLIIRFLRGARRLNPPRPNPVPSWDLPLVLMALQRVPFEPLQSAELRTLSIKTVLLTVLASIKRVGDLHAFSINKSCLEFGLAWLCAQGYHHAFQGSGGEPATAALGGGRPSPSFALSRSRFTHIHYIAKSIGSPPSNEQVWLL